MLLKKMRNHLYKIIIFNLYKILWRQYVLSSLKMMLYDENHTHFSERPDKTKIIIIYFDDNI